jgi:hypothetical protein
MRKYLTGHSSPTSLYAAGRGVFVYGDRGG